jgi:hypothetical protein
MLHHTMYISYIILFISHGDVCYFLNPQRLKLIQFESLSYQGVLDTTLCDKVCQWLVTGQLFSPCILVSSTNKTDCHDITEILSTYFAAFIQKRVPYPKECCSWNVVYKNGQEPVKCKQWYIYV